MPNRSSIFNFDRRDPLLALVVFIAAVIVLETCFAFIPDNRLVRAFHERELPPVSPDWQVMGDSVAQGGIIEGELSACLRHSFVHNAALAGTGPEFSYFILKRELAEGKAPRAILYAPSPHTFDTRRVALLVGGYARWGEIREVFQSRREVCEVIYGVLCKLSYTLRSREPLGRMLRGKHTPQENEVNLDAVTNQPGAADQPVQHFTVEGLRQRYKNPFKPFTVLPFNSYFLEKFLELAAAHHIPVYWVTMPVNQAVLDGRKPFRFSEDYYAYLADLQSRHRLVLLQKTFPVFDDELFNDCIHLNGRGAKRFTHLLAQNLLVEEKSGGAAHPR
jgi:hypothetical protein